MKTAALRAVAALAILTGVLSVGVARANAADASAVPGTLGAQVSAVVIADENPRIEVVNLGALRTQFTATVPDGWGVAPAQLTLGPNEHGWITLTGSGDAGVATVVGEAVGAAGTDHAVIKFPGIQVMQSRPFDPSRLIAPLIYGLLAVLAIGLLLRRVRPWELRLSRA